MKYYWEIVEGRKGNLYELTKEGKQLIKKGMVLTTQASRDILAAVVCQQVAMGKSLDQICTPSSVFPDKFEFYHWVSSDADIAMWFHEAERLRTRSVIEKFYEQIETSKELDDKSVNAILEVLKKLTTHLTKDNVETGVQTVVHHKLWTPKILEKFYKE